MSSLVGLSKSPVLSKSPGAPEPPPIRRQRRKPPTIPTIPPLPPRPKQKRNHRKPPTIPQRKPPTIPPRKTPPIQLPEQVTAKEAERRLKEYIGKEKMALEQKRNNPPGNPQTIANLPPGPPPPLPPPPQYIPSSIGSFNLAPLKNPYLASSLGSIRNPRGVNVDLASPLSFESPLPPSKTPPPPKYSPPEYLRHSNQGGRRKTRRNSKRKKRKTRKRKNKRKSRRRKIRKNKRKSRRRRR